MFNLSEILIFVDVEFSDPIQWQNIEAKFQTKLVNFWTTKQAIVITPGIIPQKSMKPYFDE